MKRSCLEQLTITFMFRMTRNNVHVTKKNLLLQTEDLLMTSQFHTSGGTVVQLVRHSSPSSEDACQSLLTSHWLMSGRSSGHKKAQCSNKVPITRARLQTLKREVYGIKSGFIHEKGPGVHSGINSSVYRSGFFIKNIITFFLIILSLSQRHFIHWMNNYSV